MEHPVIVSSDNEIGETGDLSQKSLAKYLASSAGRRQLAASMAQPIRNRLDYQSIARKVFLVEPLPDGAKPIYDRDDLVKFDHDEVIISSKNKIKDQDDFWEQLVLKARQQIMDQEDQEIFKILDEIAATESGNKDI